MVVLTSRAHPWQIYSHPIPSTHPWPPGGPGPQSMVHGIPSVAWVLPLFSCSPASTKSSQLRESPRAAGPWQLPPSWVLVTAKRWKATKSPWLQLLHLCACCSRKAAHLQCKATRCLSGHSS